MIRRPPRSTLFPYTDALPIFVARDRPDGNSWVLVFDTHAVNGALQPQLGYDGRRDFTPRSEEHTSELQSQSNLVCRLLLEKKKITKSPRHQSKSTAAIHMPEP